MGIKFVSTGRYLPNKVLTNFDLEKMVDDFENLLEKVSIGHLT